MPLPGVAELEIVLGHRFRDPLILERSLMHRSRLVERGPDEPDDDNEKLEFLGDSVLELVVREELVRNFPLWREGELSKTRTRLVNKSSLCVAAQRLELGRFLRLGRGEEKTGGRSKPALLADAYEAVVAAIYLDAGLETAREFVRRSLIEAALAAEAERGGSSDHKSRLQELLQARGVATGTYRVVEETGPDHRKTFRVEVRLADGLTAFGHGNTKKEAEQFAALAALKQLGAEKD
jgi:ribonuclease-3